MEDRYSNDVETAAYLAEDHEFPADRDQDFVEGIRASTLRSYPPLPVPIEDFDVRSSFGPQNCQRCDALITQAEDGAWEDERGACGCGDDEHTP